VIYIVIPVYNRKNYTQACINSLVNQSINDYKIIVVDHGSTDGTSELIERDFSQAILLKGDDSLWWAGATNLGVVEALRLSKSNDDFVLTLNNDLVVDGNYLEELLNIYNQKKPCLVGSLSLYITDHEKIHYAGVKWNSITAKYAVNSIKMKPYSFVSSNYDFIDSDLLPGRGTLLPINVFKEFGLYDAHNFPHYAADEDFSLMCKRNGYELIVAVKATVKSHIEDTGINFTHHKLSFKQFLNSLSSIKSANNISIRYRWAKKNSQAPYLYFVFDTIRIFGSYCRSIIKK
jgi:GT2 family glycosyltransferase